MRLPRKTKNQRQIERSALRTAMVLSEPGRGACESPIERALLPAMRSALPEGATLQAQVAIGPYRADFVVSLGVVQFVVEADGAKWHGEDRAGYDARRDAFMRERGYRVVRLTGVQITRSPTACAAKVLGELGA